MHASYMSLLRVWHIPAYTHSKEEDLVWADDTLVPEPGTSGEDAGGKLALPRALEDGLCMEASDRVKLDGF